MSNLNTDQVTRDEILGIYAGGIALFKGLTFKDLDKLLADHYLELDDVMDNGKSIQELYDFMKNHRSSFTAHGIAVSCNRDDYRIQIEGLEGKTDEAKAISDFLLFCEDADELTVIFNDNDHYYQRAWWD